MAHVSSAHRSSVAMRRADKPAAAQGAAFEKYGDADAWSVVNGVAFNIEDQRLLHNGYNLKIYVSHQGAKDTKKVFLTQRQREKLRTSLVLKS